MSLCKATCTLMAPLKTFLDTLNNSTNINRNFFYV